ncbi:MAG TPA: gas vesicle protein [Vicinamibacterales bacterium]|nr:gas vesicle protein [Vicinamibacterales bacterium]
MPSDLTRPQTAGLVEVLDRVLDKGLFVGGDIKISLAEVELLTIRIRLIVCSLDKAREMGLDWWTHDRHLSPGRPPRESDHALEARVQMLERQLLQNNRARPPRSTRERRAVTRAVK